MSSAHVAHVSADARCQRACLWQDLVHLIFQNNSKHAELTVPREELCLGPLVLCTGLIEATLLVLQHSLEWSLMALQLMHAVQPYIKPVHQRLVIRLHGIKLISAFLRPPLRTKEEHAGDAHSLLADLFSGFLIFQLICYKMVCDELMPSGAAGACPTSS